MDHDAPYFLHQLAVPGEERFPALALVNTRFTVSHGPVDLLEDAAAGQLWLVRHGLLPDRVALTDQELDRLRELREAVRELLAARAAGREPAAARLVTLNAALAAAPPTPRLAWTGEGPRRTAEPAAGDPSGAALAQLADDAAELLTGPDAAQLAECGARGCARWFLRSHAARRWCTTKCGNRVRAARHYAARKGQ
ncbi:CGNR zinc finger domain-containing protein [Streptomyces sp. 796.1]|uniref:CGNR zinc finger domain-containing protein n=1 Tax=Streptomyces sp. 796.1 TaxID=3163029 RepID=UPI0039C9E8B4